MSRIETKIGVRVDINDGNNDLPRRSRSLGQRPGQIRDFVEYLFGL